MIFLIWLFCRCSDWFFGIVFLMNLWLCVLCVVRIVYGVLLDVRLCNLLILIIFGFWIWRNYGWLRLVMLIKVGVYKEIGVYFGKCSFNSLCDSLGIGLRKVFLKWYYWIWMNLILNIFCKMDDVVKINVVKLIIYDLWWFFELCLKIVFM